MNRFWKRFLLLAFLLVVGGLLLPAGPLGAIWEGGNLETALLLIAYMGIGILTLRTLASLGDSDADER
ncbi:MAG: hypothetical protein LAT58_12520 [Opitutales bacterium]|nr:hypothetical protein [Opitutales bacterium]